MATAKAKKEILKYIPSQIESKWQNKWEEVGLYEARDFDKRPKFYVLIEFPYPSGAGLHVGHVRSWSAMDAYSRKKRMEGKNVLYSIGWDAFGLPAENYALKMHVHPSTIVPKNITRFKRQCKSLGLSFDWSREINTTDPKYYKWTQWIFLKFFEKGLAYRAGVPVNWCPACKTNLADEEVLPDGTHERCGNLTEKRMQKQWLLNITKYADRLLEDLKLVDYSPKIAVQQVNWIGRSEGTLIRFVILSDSEGSQDSSAKPQNDNRYIEVFTTRPDTLYGATFMVLSPENSLSKEIARENSKVAEYIKKAQTRTEQERIAEGKEKTGVDTGLVAINPVNNKEIPVWVADYVIMGYGTGAIMAVPAHDLRDFEFAKKYNLPIKTVILSESEGSRDSSANPQNDNPKGAYTGEGKIVNSGEWNGLNIPEEISKTIDWLEKKGLGKREIHYHIRDWVFSRQHYWGEPIPVVYCANCAKNKISNLPSKTRLAKGGKSQISNIKETDYAIVPVPEDQLPVELPYLEKYEPSGTGESPLANAKDWVDTQCPVCKGPAKRETDTMPNWAGSNWYFLRYLDPQNDKAIAARKKMEYFMPIDIYQGGFEHTTLHLLYSRFVYKFLYDIGVVPGKEPYKKRRSHGIVLGPDGRKMSKSFDNIINPDDIVNKFGADTLRIYEMFMGPFDQTIVWSEESVEGCSRFLKRVWQLSLTKVSDKNTSVKLASKLHKTIKKVSEDLGNLKFNTAVASLMEFIKDWRSDKEGLNRDDLKKFLLILAPFAPHMTEEIWQKLQNPKLQKSIHIQSWPKFDTLAIVEEEVTIVIQINGKIRDTLVASREESENQQLIEKIAKESQKIKKYLSNRKIRKIVFVKSRVINFVVV